ncbi:acetyl-CoA C-acyltransferase [Sphingobacteriales bacterium UPWRP_1]|nr:beta-ketoadipyl CoA thiolase [Sphingobacteriales bacterium TSM_CSM]PSJ79151.1 acetyl-CoA C-acyltransferase [Sphingobacteriales bacterium UPWRP_1]
MTPVYVIDALRTPIGSYGGTLSSMRPDDLAAHVIRALLQRNPQIAPALIEDVILGAANQAGEDNRNVARMALLLAGLPVETGGVTVNRLCASGLQAVMDAARGIMLGEGMAYIAGGAESMSRAPFVMAKADTAFSRQTEVYDTTLGWRFLNARLAKLYHPYSMGETAENVARQWNISRTEQDEFALESQQKYQQAFAQNRFKPEIVPVEVQPNRKTPPVLIDTDEHPRQTTLEKLAKLPAAFVPNGTVTAGNSSGINDGAAALLLVSETLVKQLQLQPLARVVSMAIAGVDPQYMGIGPVPATQKALKRAGLAVNNIDLVELNEAFASQSLACMRDLNLNPQLVNVNGGAIALGHPLGCSGARISATLLHELQRRNNARYGLATMCIGVGQGAAIIYEKC